MLLKALQEADFKVKCLSTVPTIGTNVLHLVPSNSKKSKITIQEIGGEMESIWYQYFNNCTALIYVIDSSDLAKIGQNTLNLIKILKHHLVKEIKPVHIVLTKIDQMSCLSINELVYRALFLDDIINSFSCNSITVTGCSSFTGEGIETVFNWIQEL